MTEALIVAVIAFLVVWGIRKAVETGVRDAHRPAEPPSRRNGMGWRNDRDKRAR